MARFLAMAKLKQAWLCSFGLTKTFMSTLSITTVQQNKHYCYEQEKNIYRSSHIVDDSMPRLEYLGRFSQI